MLARVTGDSLHELVSVENEDGFAHPRVIQIGSGRNRRVVATQRELKRLKEKRLAEIAIKRNEHGEPQDIVKYGVDVLDKALFVAGGEDGSNVFFASSLEKEMLYKV